MRRRLAKGVLPLFAPLVLAPIVTPVGASSSTPTNDVKRIKNRISNLKVMKFNQVAYSLYNQMALQQTGLRFEVFDKALTGYYNMKHKQEVSDKPVLTIVDFTKSSNEKRLWVVDLEKKEVLFNTYVSHGRNSGDEYAENFSNQEKSFMSSIGFYVTENTYYGKHGLSLKLEGLDKEFNNNAKDRCIVMHGAEYATEEFIAQAGRLGRSLGCPAIPMDEHEDIIKTVVGGTALYIHAAHDAYTSQYLDHVTAMAELVNENQKDVPPTPAT
ncbi:murein L,D-transpeptidase catalytic domain family protein [uncultured Pontibacter sp.]|uniref:murein L,D-transpeptidase catalytic domain family protein n=1 Tax=uncultured Pontibacter sp. TaxID=453356 RepID=UPI00261EE2AD|nr:murein L,D-transpeptidase catalytic domain family protein [uncultured Pontibacter sp.]